MSERPHSLGEMSQKGDLKTAPQKNLLCLTLKICPMGEKMEGKEREERNRRKEEEKEGRRCRKESKTEGREEKRTLRCFPLNKVSPSAKMVSHENVLAMELFLVLHSVFLVIYFSLVCNLALGEVS